jgi:hypothetical protein
MYEKKVQGRQLPYSTGNPILRSRLRLRLSMAKLHAIAPVPLSFISSITTGKSTVCPYQRGKVLTAAIPSCIVVKYFIASLCIERVLKRRQRRMTQELNKAEFWISLVDFWTQCVSHTPVVMHPRSHPPRYCTVTQKFDRTPGTVFSTGTIWAGVLPLPFIWRSRLVRGVALQRFRFDGMLQSV